MIQTAFLKNFNFKTKRTLKVIVLIKRITMNFCIIIFLCLIKQETKDTRKNGSHAYYSASGAFVMRSVS